MVTFMRMSPHWEDAVLCAFNFTPVVRHNYRIGVPHGGRWEEILNSDAPHFGGSGQGNFGGLDASPMTLSEIGEHYELTRERIRQIEARALGKLRHPSTARLWSAGQHTKPRRR